MLVTHHRMSEAARGQPLHVLMTVPAVVHVDHPAEDDEHRLVHKVTETEVRIAACRCHYG